MAAQKDHSGTAYRRAWLCLKLLRKVLSEATMHVGYVIPKTYARDFSRIDDAILNLEMELERRIYREKDLDPNWVEALLATSDVNKTFVETLDLWHK